MEYVWRKGIIEQARKENTGNMFRCRVQPDMNEIDSADLPLYPNFFRSENFAYQDQDEVWLLCTEDYTVGFIVGYCQPPMGESINSLIQLINVAEQEAGMTPSGYNQITILRAVNKSLSFVNNDTGQSGTVNSTGYVSLVSKDCDIYIRNPNFTLRISNKGAVEFKGKELKTEFEKQIEKYTSSQETGASKKLDLSGSFKVITGGTLSQTAGSNFSQYTVQNSDYFTGYRRTEKIGMGETKTIVAVGSKTSVLAGNYSVNVGLGTMDLSATVGKVSIFGGLQVDIRSLLNITIKAPIINFPSGAVTPNLASYIGMGGPFCAIAVCPFSGLPHQGTTVTGFGI